jgi:Periplasmic binding proteins and sugar binding domain of LacI family
MRHSFDVALVEGLYPAAEQLGCSVALGATGPSRDERKAIEDLLGYRIQALILIGPYLSRNRLATLAHQLPVVEIGRGMNLAGVDSVRTADYRGAQLAVDRAAPDGGFGDTSPGTSKVAWSRAAGPRPGRPVQHQGRHSATTTNGDHRDHRLPASSHGPCCAA